MEGRPNNDGFASRMAAFEDPPTPRTLDGETGTRDVDDASCGKDAASAVTSSAAINPGSAAAFSCTLKGLNDDKEEEAGEEVEDDDEEEEDDDDISAATLFYVSIEERV